MSIADRISSMASNLSSAYGRITYLGVDTSQIDKNMQNLSTVLDTVYNDYPKVSDEGISPSLSGTKAGRLSTTLKGNTSQDGTPTPDNPVDTNVVKGNNTVEVRNIQLFNINDTLDGYFTNDSGGLNTSQEGFHTNQYINVEDKTTIYLRFEALSNIRIGRFWIQEYDKNYNSLSRTLPSGFYDEVFTTNQVQKFSVTLNSDTKYIRLSAYSLSELEGGSYVAKKPVKDNWDTYVKATISFNDTDIYTNYAYSAFPITLPTGLELCKIGDYQDYIYRENGNWYKYGAIGEVVLNGSEAWQGGNVSTGSPNYTYVFTASKDSLLSDYAEFYCDKFKVRTTQMVTATSVDTDTIYAAGTQYAKVRIMILTSRLSEQSSNGFKTWLSNNNITMYHVLATPTITQITDTTLVSQLNALYNAMSYSGETNILQTNADLPFIISASALKAS